MPRGGVAARGPLVGVLRSVAHRRAESRFWGVFIIVVHRAFVLGLGARHRGIVELSEGVIRCVTVFACYSSSSLHSWPPGHLCWRDTTRGGRGRAGDPGSCFPTRRAGGCIILHLICTCVADVC